LIVGSTDVGGTPSLAEKCISWGRLMQLAVLMGYRARHSTIYNDSSASGTKNLPSSLGNADVAAWFSLTHFYKFALAFLGGSGWQNRQACCFRSKKLYLLRARGLLACWLAIC
jgi:hypothetical protein